MLKDLAHEAMNFIFVSALRQQYKESIVEKEQQRAAMKASKRGVPEIHLINPFQFDLNEGNEI